MVTEFEKTGISGNLARIEGMILSEVAKDGQVDLNAFCNLVDLFTYMPKKLSKVS